MKLPRRQFLRLALGVVAIRTSTGKASAYPTRPVRLVVPFPPGGAFDTVARPWAEKVKPLLGTVIIENISGAGSSLGAAAVAHSPPDGYNLLFGGTIPHINEVLIKSRPLYDPNKDLMPITNVVNASLGIGIHPSLPVHSLKELVDYDKANPGKLSFGHVGIGSINHLTGELFKSLTGTSDIIGGAVPRRGAGDG
jgi:tripartite-type tricarboxylate transporter receptor subunit TctC